MGSITPTEVRALQLDLRGELDVAVNYFSNILILLLLIMRDSPALRSIPSPRGRAPAAGDDGLHGCVSARQPDPRQQIVHGIDYIDGILFAAGITIGVDVCPGPN